MRTAIGLAVCAVMGSACGIEDVETADLAQDVVNHCPAWGCANSPDLIHLGIWEQNLDGLPDANGYSLQTSNGKAALYSGGLTYELRVSGGKITGFRRGVMTPTTISGAQLVGATMVVTLNGTPTMTISIANVHSGIPYPLGTGTYESYEMHYSTGILGKAPNLCNAPDEQVTRDAGLNLPPNDTVVFEGDRYNPTTMTTNTSATTADSRWFNFGCAGYTLSKLRLTRHTLSDGTSFDERQAMLKMYVADYCGTGKVVTVSGEPLRWRGGALMHDFLPTPDTLEARWAVNGAKCISTPRMTAHPDLEVFPDPAHIRDAVISNCPWLPVCSDTDIEHDQAALRISANPI